MLATGQWNAEQAYYECERLFTEGCEIFGRMLVSTTASELKGLIEHHREIRNQHHEMRLCLALLIERETATLN